MKKYEITRKDGTVKHYDFMSEFVEGFAAVELNGKWGFIDTEGNEICPIKYGMSYLDFYNKTLDIRFFHEGYAVVAMPKGRFLRYSYIDTKGNVKLPFAYKQAYDFINGHALVIDEEGKFSLINREFKTITKRPYDMIYRFYCGCAVVKLNGLYGFINEEGEEMCEIKYTYMSSFSDKGFAQIQILNPEAGKIYFIDTQGKAYYMNYVSDEMYPLT